MADRVHRVAYLLDKLRRELEGMTHSVFPGADERKQRFLEVVRECDGMLWDRSRGVGFRKDLKPMDAARVMKEKMRGLLLEACVMKCANIWYLEPIKEILGEVNAICAWLEGAAERQQAREAAEAAAAAEEAAAYAEVEARGTVTVETETEKGKETGAAIELIPASREKLRVLVGEMRINLYILKQEVKNFDKDLLFCITVVEKYQQSCCGDKTWIWNAKEWSEARNRLQICVESWAKEMKRSIRLHGRKEAMTLWWPTLQTYCDQCVRDMERYKQLCERSSTRDDKTYYAGFRRYWNLECKLEALKTLA
jgi:hypothetical protein